MAPNTPNTSRSGRQSIERSNSESVRWVVGLVVFFLGVYLAIAVFSSFFNWQADQSGLQLSSEERITLSVKPENLSGWTGARIGRLLVDNSFGFFGMLIPVIIMLIGVRIIRGRSLLLNHSILALFLIMIFGSLTLGFAFVDKLSICCSTGWGGAFGIEISALLQTHIGVLGTVILLLVGWILIGVFINRNFINRVNNVGNAVLEGSGKIVEAVKERVAPATFQNVETPPLRRVEPAAPPRSAEPPIEIHRPKPSEQEEEKSPFTELSPDGEPVENIIQHEPHPNHDDDIFTEIDLSHPDGRVIMGAGGLIELARPKPRYAEQQPTGEFTELTIEPQTEGIIVDVEVNRAKMVDEKSITTESYDPLKDLPDYRRPPVTLLEDYMSDTEVSAEEIFENKSKIEQTLKDFGIEIQKIKATVGPTVTLYEIVQAQGIKISKIQGLENDIAQSLKALGIRIIAPIPGKGTIGIEVPNRDKQIVSMYSSVRSQRFQELKAALPVVIGRTIQNENYVFDLAKMPHLLVAGATGQGKSVGLNAIITSLLYRKHPAELKFVMIDPKMVEFSIYAKLERHFLAKMESEEDAIITDPRKAVYTLNALCTEMDARLELCKKAGTRNISEYNEKFTERRLNPNNGHRYLPYIVVVVDEFADLIMTAREVEAPVMRLAQKARAVGIHLIIATQRPDVKVITGGIKANFPARIAFRVMQMIDSRTIIDQPGANQLIGRGDMLLSKDGELTRIQCALVETKEVDRVVDHISKQQGYTAAYSLPDYTPDSGDAGSMMGSEEPSTMKYDPLFGEIARDAVSGGNISTSMIQRNYEVGFNRAGRIMMQLERAGIVSRQMGAKPRDILFHDLTSLEARLQELGIF